MLSEKEQVEQLRQWWRDNGWFLIGGAALGGLALLGWNQYWAYQATNYGEGRRGLRVHPAGDCGAQSRAGQHAAEADACRLIRARRTRTQAGLAVARAELITDPQRATDDLRYTMEHSKDTELAMIARLRLARVLAYREQYPDALAILTVDKPGKFAGRINEVKGDIFVAAGQGRGGARRVPRRHGRFGRRSARSQFPADEARRSAGQPAPSRRLRSRAPRRRRLNRRKRRSRERVRESAASPWRSHCSRCRFVIGCASKKDKAEPPAAADGHRDRRSTFDKLWSGKVGRARRSCAWGCAPRPTARTCSRAGTTARSRRSTRRPAARSGPMKTDLVLAAGPAFGDGVLVFGTSDGELVALDATSGEQKWLQTIGSEVVASPVIASGVVVLRTVDGRLARLRDRDRQHDVERAAESSGADLARQHRAARRGHDRRQRLRQRSRRRVRPAHRRRRVGSRRREPDAGAASSSGSST